MATGHRHQTSLLCIAPAAARVEQKITTKLKPLDAAIGQVLWLLASFGHTYSVFEKELQMKSRPHLTIRV
jgi:hypothetical protein